MASRRLHPSSRTLSDGLCSAGAHASVGAGDLLHREPIRSPAGPVHTRAVRRLECSSSLPRRREPHDNKMAAKVGVKIVVLTRLGPTIDPEDDYQRYVKVRISSQVRNSQ
jgi:hypothetical protein